MRKFLFTVLLALTTAGANAQLLYKITGKDLQKPSYIVGTHHLIPAAFASTIPGIQEALNGTAQVYGEMNIDEQTSPENMQKLQAAMLLPDGKTLKDVITADEMKRLNAFLKEKMGADLSNPMVEQQMGRITPMALTTQLQVLLYLSKHMGQFDPTNLIDGYFQQVAKKNNMGIGGLETMDFQIKTMFQSMTLERQKTLLMCLIDNAEFTVNMLDKITDAYNKQDIDALKTAMDEKIGNSCDNTPEEDAILIYNRNTNWVKLMPEIMAKSPTLFVVGAAHLPSDKGVLQLLRNEGYTVEGMK